MSSSSPRIRSWTYDARSQRYVKAPRICWSRALRCPRSPRERPSSPLTPCSRLPRLQHAEKLLCDVMKSRLLFQGRFLPDDEAVPGSIRLQRPFVLAEPGAPSARAVRRLAADFLGEDRRGGGLGGFLSRLVGWFR